MAFSLGVGPGCWLVASEVFPLAIRAKAMALATVANRATSTLIATTFLSWARAMTYAGYFYFFACLAVFVWLALFFYLPETSGRSLEEMAAYFEEATGGEAPSGGDAAAARNPMGAARVVADEGG